MAKLPEIRLKKLYHRKQNHIGLEFNYNEHLISIIREFPYAKWSNTHRLWYLKNHPENLKKIYKSFKNEARIHGDNFFKSNNTKEKPKTQIKKKRVLNKNQKSLLNNFYKYLKGKRYSKSTIDSYTFFIADFIEFHNTKDVSNLNNRDVELFIEAVFIKRNYSISTQRQFISAVKLFIKFEPSTQINNLELTRPKKSRILPEIISQEEIINLLQQTKNLKHRTVIALLYSCGLRISELINLKLKDIDINRLQLFVKDSKGRKDRYIGIAESFIPLLNNYIASYSPKTYFVEGKNNSKYSTESVRQFLKKNAQASGIKKNVTPHTLRHSYATHLLENGVDIRYIQSLLGHARPETTMIYTHVKRKDLLDIVNPLDLAVKKVINKTNTKLVISRK